MTIIQTIDGFNNTLGGKMKKLLTLLAVGSFAILTADQYYQPYGDGSNYCPSCNNAQRYYQDEPNNGQYYQGNNGQYYQGRGNYNQRQNNFSQDNGYYQRNNQYDYQQQPSRNQYDQNQPYYQQQGNRSYGVDQNTNDYRNQQSSNQRTVSDQAINKKIQDKLSPDWLSKGFKNISYDVNNGTVTLKGSIDTLENKNTIEESVRKIDGVKQVNNQIQIVKEEQ